MLLDVSSACRFTLLPNGKSVICWLIEVWHATHFSFILIKIVLKHIVAAGLTFSFFLPTDDDVYSRRPNIYVTVLMIVYSFLKSSLCNNVSILLFLSQNVQSAAIQAKYFMEIYRKFCLK